jgi:hypothetical protein
MVWLQIEQAGKKEKKNCRKKLNQLKNVNGQNVLTCAKTC